MVIKYHKVKPAKNKYTYASLMLESLKLGTKSLKRKRLKSTLTDYAKSILAKTETK